MVQQTRRQFVHSLSGAVLASLVAGWRSTRAATSSSKNATDYDQIAGLSLAEASGQFRFGIVSSTDLTRACLARIATLDSKLDAFITVFSEVALARAAKMDAERAAGRIRGPLHGIPIDSATDLSLFRLAVARSGLRPLPLLSSDSASSPSPSSAVVPTWLRRCAAGAQQPASAPSDRPGRRPPRGCGA